MAINKQNLKPCRTKEEARERGKKGGKASGISRRLAATFREAALNVLDEEKSLKDEAGKVVGKTNGREALMNVLMRQAVKGNIKAIEMLLKISGEGVAEKIEISGKDGSDLFKGLTNKELEDKVKELNRKLGL